MNPAAIIVEGLREGTFAGLPAWLVETPRARAAISRFGGQLLSYAPAGHDDLLWLSPALRPLPAPIELDQGQVQVAAVDAGAEGILVDAQAGHGRHAGGMAVAAQHRIDPGDHLARAEWLAHIVVGADLQAEQAVHLVGARGDHDHRHVAEAAQLAADLHAVAVRQHQVQQHQVRPQRAYRLHRAGAVVDPVVAVAGRLQVLAEHRGQARLVLHDQHPAGVVHAHGVSRSGRCTVMRSPPSGEGVASMRPPCASTMLRPIASPSPLPPLARLRESSAR
jgi:hypothetical protein